MRYTLQLPLRDSCLVWWDSVDALQFAPACCNVVLVLPCLAVEIAHTCCAYTAICTYLLCRTIIWNAIGRRTHHTTRHCIFPETTWVTTLHDGATGGPHPGRAGMACPTPPLPEGTFGSLSTRPYTSLIRPLGISSFSIGCTCCFSTMPLLTSLLGISGDDKSQASGGCFAIRLLTVPRTVGA